jgi:prepilin-type processing-associated H-X9-DG protein
VILSGADAPGWFSSSFAGEVGYQVNTVGRSESSAVHPAQTVAFTSAESWCTTNSGAAQFATPDYDLANPPGTEYQEYLATNRLIFVGLGSSAPLWENNWMKNSPLGELTTSVRALSPYVGANVAWVDGHVSNMTADELAAGTDFETANTTENNSTGTGVTDVTKFFWTLDGTLNDAGNP